MLYVVDRRNCAAYAAQLEEMYRIRYRIYVEGRGRRALARPDGREIDQFDTDEAVYLLGLDAAGHVTSVVRLVPTTGPTLLRDVFSHAVTCGRIPRDECIYEMTRYFLSNEPQERVERWLVAGEVLCAMFEYALAAGLKQLSLVCDAFFMPALLESGWKVHPLGLPTPYDERTCITVLFDVSEAALAGTRATRGVSSPALTFSPCPPPFAEPNDRALAA